MNEEDRKYIDKALEKIVPSRELCEQIPVGKFADSALSWYRDMRYQGSIDLIPSFLGVEKRRIPAPTLAEILAEIGDDPRVSIARASRTLGGWRVTAQNERGNCSYSLFLDDNPADAALRLWLEVEARHV